MVAVRKPDAGQYWEISNSKGSIYAYFLEKDPFMVHFFEQNIRCDAYRLNDLIFEVLLEGLPQNIGEPQLISVGGSQVNFVLYFFKRFNSSCFI